MSDELFASKSHIEIEVFYTVEKSVSGNPVVRIIDEKDARKLLADEKLKEKVKSFRTQWRQPSWASQNDVLAKSTVFNHFKGDNEIDPFKYRDSRLKTYLIGWNLKDSKNNDIPLTSEAIDQLHQPIGVALLDKFDEVTAINREEQAKN